MKSLLFTFILILIASLTFGQEKYLIYFKDKGIERGTTLNKSSDLYKKALNDLTEHAIERRKKTMGDEIITYEDLPIKEEYILQLESKGIKVVHKLTWFNAVSAYLGNDQIVSLKNLSFIKKIELVKKLIYKKEDIPEDNFKREINKNNLPANPVYKKDSPGSLDLNYGFSFEQLKLCDIPIVHSKGITGQGIILGLLDTGFDWSDHEALVNTNVIGEHDFVFDDSITANQLGDDPSQHNHGTSVMSEVAGFKDSTLIGASFGSSFILAKTEYVPTETHVEEDNYAAALIWMENLGVDATSSSLGYSDFDPGQTSYTYADMNGQTTIVTQACELAFSRGVVTITSAGNEGNNPWFYIVAPADGFNTITVGAVNNLNQVASFSSHGPTFDGRIKPDILTQGVGIFAVSSSGFTNYTSSFGGTSAAAPIALGIAGLLLSAHPHLTSIQVRQILQKTSDNFNSPDNSRGYGLASAKNAINYPNFEMSGNSYKIHKIFINDIIIDPATVKFNYSIDGGNFQVANMDFDGTIRYNYLFSNLNSNQSIEFFFTYDDINGSSYREPVKSNYGGTAANTEIIPNDFILSQNYPNPFNPITTIRYQIRENGFVTLKVYDILGNEVKTLISMQQSKGTYSVVFNASNFASGVYIYKIQINNFTSIKKMMLLK